MRNIVFLILIHVIKFVICIFNTFIGIIVVIIKLKEERPKNMHVLFIKLTFNYPTCMANSAENKSFCEVPKYVINTRPHCPMLVKFMDELPKQLKLMSAKIIIFLNLKC